MSSDPTSLSESGVTGDFGAYVPLSPGMVDESTGELSVALARAERAVMLARAAQRAWAARGTVQRAAIMERFRRLVFAERERIARTVSEETGKPMAESLVADVAMALEGARFLTRKAHRILAPRHTRSQVLAAWRKSITTYYEPYGVIAVVSPWNYPFFFPAMHVMTALVAGNAVLLKPSELTPQCADHIVRLLHAAGVPHDVVQLLHGDGRMGAAVVSASVDKVLFTGSERTGRSIAVACAPRFVPVSLELGGSDAAIVCEDANVSTAASGIVWGRFTNAGQTCVAIKRVIAVGSAYDALLQELTEKVSALAIGTDVDTDDMGPVITATQRTLIMSQLDDAIAHGATVHVRVEPRPEAGSVSSGASGAATPARERLAPAIVLTNVTPAMRVWNEETFGPLLVVVKAASDGVAIQMANNSRFGLNASVWTADRKRGARIAAELQAGAVTINDAVTAAGLPEVSHGGVKASGIGRIHGIEGLMECVRTRTVVDDALPGTRQPWWFGYGAGSAANVDGYLRLAHGTFLWNRLSGLPGTLRLMFRQRRKI